MVERAALCELFDAVGPDAPTVLDGWTTRDLAAHLVVRERRLDAAPGILFAPLAGYAEKVRLNVAEQPWDVLVNRVRNGPPRLSPMRVATVDRLVNSIEFFVHHEDVRRASAEWERRSLPDELNEALLSGLRRARMLLHGVEHGVVLHAVDALDERGDPQAVTVRNGEPAATVSGPCGELALFCFGRDSAQVDVGGDPAAAAALVAARRGI